MHDQEGSLSLLFVQVQDVPKSTQEYEGERPSVHGAQAGHLKFVDGDLLKGGDE